MPEAPNQLSPKDMKRVQTILAGDDTTKFGVVTQIVHRLALVPAVPNEKANKTHPVQIDRFKIGDQLGQGSFGTVYRATDTSTNAVCAIKLAIGPVDDKFVASLEQEAKALSQVNHPSIVKVFGRGYDMPSQRAWVAIELISGMSLAQKIQERKGESTTHAEFVSFGSDSTTLRKRTTKSSPSKRIQEYELKEFIRWFRQGASAIQALDNVGLVHRDIKPANMMVSDEGTFHLIDFGISLNLDEDDFLGVLAGTVPYMSPEQTQSGYAGLDSRSDLYSLAISFWELITNEYAVKRGAGRIGYLLRIIHDPVPSISKTVGVPDTLNPIFEKALSKDVRKRYQDGSELAADLDAWLAEKAPAFAQEPMVTKAKRRMKRRPILSFILLTTLAVLFFWGINTKVKEINRRNSILEEAHAYVENRNWQEGSPFFAKHADEFGSLPAFHADHQILVHELSGSLINDMFSRQGVVVKDLESSSLHKKDYKKYLIHLDHCKSHDLLGMVAFSEVMSADFERALQTLNDNSQVRDSNLLREIRLLCLVGLNRPKEFKKEIRRLDSSETATVNALTIRAYRLIQQDVAARNESTRTQWQEVSQKTMIELRNSLGASLKTSPKHRFLKFFHALAQHELKDYAQAAMEFDHLLIDAENRSDRTGNEILFARSVFFAAHYGQGNQEKFWDKAHARAFHAIETVPQLAENMAIWLSQMEGFRAGSEPTDSKILEAFDASKTIMPWRSYHAWLSRLLDYPWPQDARPVLGAYTTNIAALAMYGASYEDAYKLALGFSDKFEAWFRGQTIPELDGTDSVYWSHSVRIWSYIRLHIKAAVKTALNPDPMPSMLSRAKDMLGLMKADLQRHPEFKDQKDTFASRGLLEFIKAVGLGAAVDRMATLDLAERFLRKAIDRSKSDLANPNIGKDDRTESLNILEDCKIPLNTVLRMKRHRQ